MSRVLLLTPPFVHLNTPYPATPILTRYLREQGHEAYQADLSLETTLALFSRRGLKAVFEAIRQEKGKLPARVHWALEVADTYVHTVDAVIAFLQGKDASLAHRICHGALFPRSPRLSQDEDDGWAFGTVGITDRARYLATCYLEDLADLLKQVLVPNYDFSRYGERLALSATSFQPLWEALASPLNLLEQFMADRLEARLHTTSPEVVGLTVPFPGNLLGALRAAQTVKQKCPQTSVVLGGGYANTELRELAEPRLFDFVDFVTLDDGERPLKALLEHLSGDRPLERLRRTFTRIEGEVRFLDGDRDSEPSTADTGLPIYDGLPLNDYLSLLEVRNPMYRLWSEGRWNKLVLAHGCYWHRCAFCDVHLPYIADYRPTDAGVLADRLEAVMAETHYAGFHFVDEAAPPAVLRALSLEILSRGLTVSWWGNIRFEKAFTSDLCRLMAAAGCIAVTGGLEAASDRLLTLMNKGVSVAQVARVAEAFTKASIMVHAYLMYGFPTQTLQELVDSLERVRQLFDAGVLQSAFWHRFYATSHSPVGRNPEAFKIRITGPPKGRFAFNDLEIEDAEGCDVSRHGKALDQAVHHYMLGERLEDPVERFFDAKVPRVSIPPDLIHQALNELEVKPETIPQRQVIWLGASARPLERVANRKGKPLRVLEISGSFGQEEVRVPDAAASWLRDLLLESSPENRAGRPFQTLADLKQSFPADAGTLDALTALPFWRRLRELGLLLV